MRALARSTVTFGDPASAKAWTLAPGNGGMRRNASDADVAGAREGRPAPERGWPVGSAAVVETKLPLRLKAIEEVDMTIRCSPSCLSPTRQPTFVKSQTGAARRYPCASTVR